MSRRDRALMLLGILGACVLVIYPTAFRLSREAASGPAAAIDVTPELAVAPVDRPAATPDAPAPALPTARIRTGDRAATFLPRLGSAWTATAIRHRGADGKQFDYDCPPSDTLEPIWGSDTYTDDSSVCTAAVHRGLITREVGGRVTIVIGPQRPSYVGSTRNGVTSGAYGAWDGSFDVVAAGVSEP